MIFLNKNNNEIVEFVCKVHNSSNNCECKTLIHEYNLYSLIKIRIKTLFLLVFNTIKVIIVNAKHLFTKINDIP